MASPYTRRTGLDPEGSGPKLGLHRLQDHGMDAGSPEGPRFGPLTSGGCRTILAKIFNPPYLLLI
jgi:hypothetical protein